MALGPTNNAAFLQEVDEAVRKDQFDSFVERFGRWIVVGVLAALLAFGGWLYWGHRQEAQRGADAEALLATLDQLKSGQAAAAGTALAALEAEGGDAYRGIAIFQQANIKAEGGDLKAAAALMAKAAADTKLDQALRDLALIRQTAFEYDALKPETVIARMKPMVDAKDPESSWFASAAELSAIAHYQLGQYKQAGDLYGRIARLPDIPRSLQSRTVQMAGMLGVDAVPDRADESAAEDKEASAAPKAPAAGATEEKK
ncbi:MAG TPA: tetratricopeptide repeat protein [Sphingopyxis sp.]|nr:tetratricopeptide repeat protein [Sphingopyxis sp.]HMP46134.1 tetratricopeptide repeat protein [Sphingopyxis sp.]HMQ19878.1 tetratricopeptide repeat protein [Sphingopyxis sp.]